MTLETQERIEVVYLVEGDRSPHSHEVEPSETVGAVLARLRAAHGREDLEELLLEDEEEALALELRLAEVLLDEFRLVHLAAKGKIKIFVGYNGREVEREFRPSATIARVIIWAISPEGLKLEGEPSDFQLKLGDEILTPETHVGQLSKHREPVRLALVFKVKPQGWR
jgi:hypothetical protein